MTVKMIGIATLAAAIGLTAGAEVFDSVGIPELIAKLPG